MRGADYLSFYGVTPVTPCYAYRNSRERPPPVGSQPLVTLLHLFPDTYTYKEVDGYGVNGVCVYRGGYLSEA